MVPERDLREVVHPAGDRRLIQLHEAIPEMIRSVIGSVWLVPTTEQRVEKRPDLTMGAEAGPKEGEPVPQGGIVHPARNHSAMGRRAGRNAERRASSGSASARARRLLSSRANRSCLRLTRSHRATRAER